MREFLAGSAYFGIVLSLAAYYLAFRINKRFKLAILNPLLLSSIMVICVLLLLNVEYQAYMTSGKYLSYLLTPATVCLAIPLYEKLSLLKSNLRAILTGVAAGTLAGMCCILLLSLAFGLDHAQYVTMLPKSVTTAIGMPLSEKLGGYPSITVSLIVATGLIGNICAEAFLKLLRITNPVAKGIAIGTSSHAMGTSRALQMGETEGAMSSLAIVITGLITVVAASVFAQFI